MAKLQETLQRERENLASFHEITKFEFQFEAARSECILMLLLLKDFNSIVCSIHFQTVKVLRHAFGFCANKCAY
jgi:hypothetical protein